MKTTPIGSHCDRTGNCPHCYRFAFGFEHLGDAMASLPTVPPHVQREAGTWCLVVGNEHELKVHPMKITSSLDAEPWFALGGASEVAPLDSAWHVLRVHHRWRLMAAPEASVERIGSLMSFIWKSEQHPDPASFMNKVALLQAHVMFSVAGILETKS